MALLCWHGYLEKKSPIVKLHRTRRHSGLCKHTERCSPEPSTSQEAGPFKIKQRRVTKGHLETEWDTARDPHIPLDDVAVVVLDVSGQTKVTDLCHAMICQQDVPRCNVSVDALANGIFPNYNPSHLRIKVHIKHGVVTGKRVLLRSWSTGSPDLEPPGRKSSWGQRTIGCPFAHLTDRQRDRQRNRQRQTQGVRHLEKTLAYDQRSGVWSLVPCCFSAELRIGFISW